MKILITGAAGRLGNSLMKQLQPAHDVTGVDVETFSVTDYAAAQAFTRQHQPELVIHCAAWTDVDGCAREPRKAIEINGHGAQNMALAAAEVGAAIVYISSNEVFDGKRSQPYREYDATHPVNPYGYSKWVGERSVTAVNPRHYITRTAWLFAHGGKNFIQAILNAAELGKPLRVVTDEVANPTYTDDLAAAIAQLIQTGRYGTYHLVNEGSCSRYNFARYALDRAGFSHVPVTPISSREWQRASLPPTYTALENIAGALNGVTLRDWREAVDAFLEAEGLRRD